MFLDLLFPKYCIGCSKIGAVLCRQCRRELYPTVQDVCPYCYHNSKNGKTHDHCLKENGLDGAISIVRYNSVAKKIVKGIKYRFTYDIYNQLVSIVPEHWWRKELYEDYLKSNTVIQPIPLHPTRKKTRGFNQSEIIAAVLSKQTNIQQVNILKRIKNTSPQARIPTRKEREQNIKGAFEFKGNKSIRDKTVILIDDIFTSGSTAKEAARVLKKVGAKNVFLYTFAHGS